MSGIGLVARATDLLWLMPGYRELMGWFSALGVAAVLALGWAGPT